MRVAVYGAGGIGRFLAYVLAKNKREVTLVVREEKLDSVLRKGVRIANKLGGRTAVEKVKAVSRLDGDTEYELLIVAVQNHRVQSVIDDLPEDLRARTILFVGNNLISKKIESSCRMKLGEEAEVHFGFLEMTATLKEDLVRYICGRNITLRVGEAAKRRGCMEKIFAGSRIKIVYEKDMESFLQTHAAFVLPVSRVYYTGGKDLKKIAKDRLLMETLVNAVSEGLSIVEEKGHTAVPRRYRQFVKRHRGWFRWLLVLIFKTKMGVFLIAEHAEVCREEIEFMMKIFRSDLGKEREAALKEADSLWVRTSD